MTKPTAAELIKRAQALIDADDTRMLETCCTLAAARGGAENLLELGAAYFYQGAQAVDGTQTKLLAIAGQILRPLLAPQYQQPCASYMLGCIAQHSAAQSRSQDDLATVNKELQAHHFENQALNCFINAAQMQTGEPLDLHIRAQAMLMVADYYCAGRGGCAQDNMQARYWLDCALDCDPHALHPKLRPEIPMSRLNKIPRHDPR